MKPLSGHELISEVRLRDGAKTILSFSTGKDSIGAWLAIRDHFEEVVPYYLYLVPGLEFVEESLAYYEGLFGRKIIRLPHPSLYRLLNNFVYQPPGRIPVIRAAKLPMFDYGLIRKTVAGMAGLADDVLAASGVRAADSPMRRVSFMTHGSISAGQYYPVWDWRKDRLLSEIEQAGIKLPIDYRLFGRTFDGIDLRFMLPIKKHLPKDYERVIEWFPLVDMAVWAAEMRVAA